MIRLGVTYGPFIGIPLAAWIVVNTPFLVQAALSCFCLLMYPYVSTYLFPFRTSNTPFPTCLALSTIGWGLVYYAMVLMPQLPEYQTYHFSFLGGFVLMAVLFYQCTYADNMIHHTPIPVAELQKLVAKGMTPTEFCSTCMVPCY